MLMQLAIHPSLHFVDPFIFAFGNCCIYLKLSAILRKAVVDFTIPHRAYKNFYFCFISPSFSSMGSATIRVIKSQS